VKESISHENHGSVNYFVTDFRGALTVTVV